MARASLISAALRHVRDAEHLLEPGPHRSVEQSLHIVGFAPECAREGCVDDAVADRAIGHDIRGADDPVIDFLLAIDPSARRMEIECQGDVLPLRAEYWSIEARYMRSGTAEETRVRALVDEARRFVDRCVDDLWCDGLVTAEALT